MKRELLLAVLLATASASCATRDKQTTQRELPKVRISVSHLLTWAPIMIAKDEGFFRDEGIDVEFVSALNAQEDLVALVSGDVDVVSGPTHAAFFSAISQGAKIKIVAGQGFLARDGCTFFGIVRRPDVSSIKSLRAGRDGFTRFITVRMLESVGVDIKKLDVMRVPDPVATRSLEKGSIDAIASAEPLLTRLKSIGPVWLAAEKIVPDFQWGTIAFGERLLYKDRDTGARFLRAYSRGVARYQQGKTERNVAIIAKATGETPDVIRKACWLPFRSDLGVNWQSLEEFQAWAKKDGFIQHVLTRDQAMDSTFVSNLTQRSTAHTQ
jgi:NitT/TauT family transport system substrate-binding protein